MKIKTNLLPAHYEKVSEPRFDGKGNHSVKELEDISEQYKELVHQLRVEKQTLLDISNSLLSVSSAMVNIFDRDDLHNGTIGKRVCNEAKQAIEKATK